MRKRIFMEFVSLFFFFFCTKVTHFLLKEWIQWLTKAAAEIISSLQGAVLVTEFYDISHQWCKYSCFLLKLQSVAFCTLEMQHNGKFGVGEAVLTHWHAVKIPSNEQIK